MRNNRTEQTLTLSSHSIFTARSKRGPIHGPIWLLLTSARAAIRTHLNNSLRPTLGILSHGTPIVCALHWRAGMTDTPPYHLMTCPGVKMGKDRGSGQGWGIGPHTNAEVGGHDGGWGAVGARAVRAVCGRVLAGGRPRCRPMFCPGSPGRSRWGRCCRSAHIPGYLM